MENEHEVICTRVTEGVKTMLVRIIKNDTHVNISDWLRVATREKLERDYPNEYEELKELET